MAVVSRSRSVRPLRTGTASEVSSEEKLVASLIALLDAGTNTWQREWDAAAGGHHVNLLSGLCCREANPVLLTLGMYLRGSAFRCWCCFAEAKTLGTFPQRQQGGVCDAAHGASAG